MCSTSLRLFLTISLLYAVHTKGQTEDTLRLSLPDLEVHFVKNSLQLLVEQYNIDKAVAGEITAKLFANPNFNYTNGLYSKTRDTNALTQQTYSLTQFIQTAGKRNKNIQLSKITTANAWHGFYDLVRVLKYSLRSSYYSLYFKQLSISLYSQEIGSLNNMLVAFRQFYQKGNVSEKEVLRIQSLLYSLAAERTELEVQANDLEMDLRTLCQFPTNIYLLARVQVGCFENVKAENTNYQQLLDSAFANRHDLKIAQGNVSYATTNLKFQQAMKYPDLNLSLNYDKKAGYGLGYVSAGVTVEIPMFKRNQGNIRLARVQIEQSKAQLNVEQNKLQNELAGSLKDMVKLDQLYRSIDSTFKPNFSRLLQGTKENFEKRNISLLEFLDLYASYKTHVMQMNNIMLERINAIEKLNFVTGTQVFNP